jgi:hypothetical protein
MIHYVNNTGIIGMENTLHGHKVVPCPCKNEAGFSSPASHTYNRNIIKTVVYSTNVLVVNNDTCICKQLPIRHIQFWKENYESISKSTSVKKYQPVFLALG